MSCALYDVAIIGGGPAGLACAIHLGTRGQRAALVEGTDYGLLRVGEHVPPGCKAQLLALGIPEVLASKHHASCPGIVSAWGAPEPAEKPYLLDPHGEGLNLSRPEFDRSLAARAKSLGTRVFTEAKVAALHAGEAWSVELSLPGGSVRLRARFLIDATGRTASLAKRLETKPLVYDALVGIAARVANATPADHTVCIEAVETGWWYSAGLADGTLIATFMTDADLVPPSSSARAAFWRRSAEAATITRSRFGADTLIDGIHSRTARTQRLARASGPGWLATGDAAMSFDPLSSEGIAKGIEWAAKAARTVCAWDEGNAAAPLAYQRDLDAAFGAYLVKHRRYYCMERRWPHSPFWRRRHAPRRGAEGT